MIKYFTFRQKMRENKVLEQKNKEKLLIYIKVLWWILKEMKIEQVKSFRIQERGK